MTIMPIFLSDFGCHNSRRLRGIITKDDLIMNITAMSIVVPKPALIIIPKAITTSSSITYFLKKMSLEARHSA